MEEIPAACDHDQCSPSSGHKRKQHLGQALWGHPAQHSPSQQGLLPPSSAPRQGMNTRLTPHIPDLEMLVGKLGEEPLQRGVSYSASYLRCSHHSPLHAMGKKLKPVSRAVDFFGRKPPNLLQATVKSCSSKEKNKQACL